MNTSMRLRRIALQIAVMVVAVTMIVLFQYADSQARQADQLARQCVADELKIQQLQAQLDQVRQQSDTNRIVHLR